MATGVEKQNLYRRTTRSYWPMPPTTANEDMEMNEGDRFQVTLEVEAVQVNNGRARLQFTTDNGTIVRFWYGVESLPITHMFREADPNALTETR